MPTKIIFPRCRECGHNIPVQPTKDYVEGTIKVWCRYCGKLVSIDRHGVVIVR